MRECSCQREGLEIGSFLMRCLAFALLAFSISTASATAQGVFPTVTADDLNGRSVTLPQEFPGETTIVFIA